MTVTPLATLKFQEQVPWDYTAWYGNVTNALCIQRWYTTLKLLANSKRNGEGGQNWKENAFWSRYSCPEINPSDGVPCGFPANSSSSLLAFGSWRIFVMLILPSAFRLTWQTWGKGCKHHQKPSWLCWSCTRGQFLTSSQDLAYIFSAPQSHFHFDTNYWQANTW